MAKQRRLKDQPYAERLERSLKRWPPENLGVATPDAITLGRWEDSSGNTWLKRRPLRAIEARKLLITADEMIVADPDSYASVERPDREVMWESIEKRGRQPNEAPSNHVTYEPYEFDSEDGQTMLFVQRQC